MVFQVSHLLAFSWFPTLYFSHVTTFTKTFWFMHACIRSGGNLVDNQAYGSTWLYWLNLSETHTPIHLCDLRELWALFLSIACYLMNATLIYISCCFCLSRMCVRAWISCVQMMHTKWKRLSKLCDCGLHVWSTRKCCCMFETWQKNMDFVGKFTINSHETKLVLLGLPRGLTACCIRSMQSYHLRKWC